MAVDARKSSATPAPSCIRAPDDLPMVGSWDVDTLVIVTVLRPAVIETLRRK